MERAVGEGDLAAVVDAGAVAGEGDAGGYVDVGGIADAFAGEEIVVDVENFELIFVIVIVFYCHL